MLKRAVFLLCFALLSDPAVDQAAAPGPGSFQDNLINNPGRGVL